MEIHVEDARVKPVKTKVMEAEVLRIVYHKDGATSIRIWEISVENVDNPVVRKGDVEIIIRVLGDIENAAINANI